MCIRAAAAAATVVEKSHPLILGHPVTVYVPHEIEILLKQYATQALSPQRVHQYEIVLLMADNINIKRCNTLNLATLIPLPDDREEHHQCDQAIHIVNKPRTDLTDEPISNPDLILFVDGSSYYQGGRRRTRYAVVNQ